MRYTISRLSIAAPIAFLAGCVQATSEGEATVFTYEWWVPVACILGGIALAVGGVLLRKRGLWAWIAVLGGLGLALILAPNLYCERVSVSPVGATLKVGFFFSPKTAEVTFADLKSISVTKTESRGRRGRKNVSYQLRCLKADGTTIEFPIGTLMEEGGVEAFIDAAMDARVPVIDQTGEK